MYTTTITTTRTNNSNNNTYRYTYIRSVGGARCSALAVAQRTQTRGDHLLQLSRSPEHDHQANVSIFFLPAHRLLPLSRHTWRSSWRGRYLEDFDEHNQARSSSMSWWIFSGDFPPVTGSLHEQFGIKCYNSAGLSRT